MIRVNPHKNHVGKRLAKDVINEKGIMLLQASHILTEADIRLILAHNIPYIIIAENKEEKKEQFAISYNLSMQQMNRLLQPATLNNPKELNEILDTFSALLESTLHEALILENLEHLYEVDHYLYQHSLNVGILATLIARLNNLPKEEAILIGKAGLLHDIGMLQIPENIRFKNGNYEDNEWKIMQQHPEKGYQLLVNNKQLSEVVLKGVLYHHERLDGSGYPFKKKKDEIPLVAQIIAIADTYDAIQTSNLYREELSPYHSYELLKDSAFQEKLNPNLLFPFLQYIADSFIGTKAELSNGEIVTIALTSQDEPQRPLVKKADGTFLDLRKERQVYIKRIIK